MHKGTRKALERRIATPPGKNVRVGNADWIASNERLPKRKDTGRYTEVLVLRDVYWSKDLQIGMFPYRQVRKTFHPYWARIPDPPETE